MNGRHCVLLLSSILWAAVPLGCLAQAVDTSVQALQKINYPKNFSTTTSANAISNNGHIVGQFSDPSFTKYSFTVAPGGKYSSPIVYPPSRTQTIATGVNTSAVICGYYYDTAGVHGFFYDGLRYTAYDVPGANSTFVRGENDSGSFIGNYTSDSTGGANVGFVNIAAAITSFSVPGAVNTVPTGINDAGEIVGYYYASNPIIVQGFFRTADGLLTFPLDYPGAVSTVVGGINDNETIVGYYYDSAFLIHGFILQLPNDFTSYDLPAASDTYIAGINNNGQIAGSYIDRASGDLFGFLGLVLP